MIPPVPVVNALSRNVLRGGRGCKRAPGLPCALFLKEGEDYWQSSGECRRENAISCVSTVMPAKAGIQYSRGLTARTLASLEYWIIRSRLRQGFDGAHDSRARRSFSGGGKPDDDGE